VLPICSFHQLIEGAEMLTALGMICLFALGILIGRYPNFLWCHSSFLFSGPKFLWFWLIERIRCNPAVLGAFFAGFFAGLLISGSLSWLFWNLSLIGLLAFCLLVFFPTISGKVFQKGYSFLKFCSERIKEIFTIKSVRDEK